MAGSAGQVPAVIASGLICLAIGAGGGVLTLMFLGFEKPSSEKPEDIQAQAWEMKGKAGDNKGIYGDGKGQGMVTGGPPPGMGGMGGLGAGTKKGGGGKGGGKGGGFGPSPKTQLTQLVTKLDVLTAKPLAIQLTDEQRSKVREQLKGLDSEDAVNDEEAKKRLDALLAALQDHKATLIEAGYFWPGEGGLGFGFGGGGQAANPFKEGKDAEHLKALDERLGKGK